MELEKLKFYRIDINYIKYLYQFDKKVQYNKNREDEYTKRRVYLEILISQYHFCNKHIKGIKAKALETYNKSLNNKFFRKVCCNFKLLEEKMKEYEE